jgi:antitoxin (DNA-binding transcriptional repressor) of toxin-antitoxin stability system
MTPRSVSPLRQARRIRQRIRRRFEPVGGVDDLVAHPQLIVPAASRWAIAVDEAEAVENWDTLLDAAECGVDFTVMRDGKAVALLLPTSPVAVSAPDWLVKAWAGAKERGIDKLTLDEINAEIAEARAAARKMP